MKKLLFIFFPFVLLTLFAGCGKNYDDEKRQTAREKAMRRKQDSLALKVGVLPTIDCLPVFIAEERGWIDTARADVRLREIESHIEADDALRKGKVDGIFTDIVRTERMRHQGMALAYVATTTLSWQFITNRKSRLKSLRQLTDKMVAVSRFSATSMLSDIAVDSAGLKSDDVFRVQINNPQTRLLMLLNNEMDAALLPEPQATVARLAGHRVLMDSGKRNMHMGVLVFSGKSMKDSRQRVQIDELVRAYNQACDSINRYGIANYADVIKKYMHVGDKIVKAIPKTRFEHAATPRAKDIDAANVWLR